MSQKSKYKLGLGRMSILENEKRNEKKNIISACTQLKGGLICKKIF